MTAPHALLLENIDSSARQVLRDAGWTVEHLDSSLSEAELLAKAGQVDFLGIRSATKITRLVLEALANGRGGKRRLVGIGCFCIGTDQVDLQVAQNLGIPVFNAPFSSSRSVAELMVAQLINLARCLGDRNHEMHAGVWNKTAKQSFQIADKTLGIVGCGKIGSQLSVLGQALGMRVLFYDTLTIMPHGTAKAVSSLEALLREADFVSLHVPLAPDTKDMMDAKRFEQMKRGAYLLNASRGNVVVLHDLVAAMRSGRVAGAYLDVYPDEPRANGSWFAPIIHDEDGHDEDKKDGNSPTAATLAELAACPNVILTPHIGGSTVEAQVAIAQDVAQRFLAYWTQGTTMQAVNFPCVSLPTRSDTIRLVSVHRNVHGALKAITERLVRFNISQQSLCAMGNIGYCIIDLDVDKGWTREECRLAVQRSIVDLPHSISTRLL